jgi:tryptophan synthase alpha chain
MGYFNPMLQFGIENFCKECAAIGIDGLIIPDLPLVCMQMNTKQF